MEPFSSNLRKRTAAKNVKTEKKNDFVIIGMDIRNVPGGVNRHRGNKVPSGSRYSSAASSQYLKSVQMNQKAMIMGLVYSRSSILMLAFKFGVEIRVKLL